jgi:two-component system CheB/CheR fusion protein
MRTRKKAAKKRTVKKAASQPKKESRTGSKTKAVQPEKARQSKAKPLASPEKAKKGFPVVGIGASAGGLKAFETFFKNMPPDSGMAFVLVPHLDPKHISILPDLLQKHTEMPVSSVTDGMKVKPNAVYVIPPNKFMAILHGVLHLMTPQTSSGFRLPVDSFFRSLAKDQARNSIAIILSGTGTDGTLGLKEVRNEGGMVMVQDPGTASYDGMPRSAQATRMVDYVLPPEKMPEQLINYKKHFSIGKEVKIVPIAGKIPEALQQIFILLRNQTGHDLSLYKPNTICRRIERRMHVHQITSVENYVRYLEENAHEVTILFKELLIGVTNFFRDPESFESLKEKVFPDLLKGKPKDYTLRVWVPGCSTGEEAYSLAILLREYMHAHKQYFKVQIFATDIDPDAITTARAGIYPGSIAADVSPDRLKQFYNHQETVYQVKKDIREMVVFAVQNVINDPSFTRLDMICCRNLLIYLGPELQEKIIPIFRYSLKTSGILFLGSSESIGGFLDLFTAVDKKWKVFKAREKGISSRPPVEFPFTTHLVESPERGDTREAGGMTDLTTAQLVEKVLLNNYAPACVVINEKSEVIYIHGRTGKYLEPASGEPNYNILAMARQGLKMKLATAIRRALTHKQEVHHEGLQVKDNGTTQLINLTVRPIDGTESMKNFLIVVFEDLSLPRKVEPKKTKRVSARKEDRRVEELEQELLYTRENLQTTIEEMETTNEELKSTNEELQSTNEELQSTNEEMETSKEELQSLNEELVTVNAELEGRLDELAKTSDDMKNLLVSTNIATIFLDINLCVTRFTPKASEIINLIQTDIGRPIAHIVSNLQYENLVDDVQKVLDNLVPMEKEVGGKKDQWYIMRISPYRTMDNVIDGVVITFEDITNLKNIQQQALDAQRYSENIIETIREPLLVLNGGMRIVSANRAYCSFFKVTEQETINKNIYDIGKRQWDIPKLKQLLGDILPRKIFFDDYEVRQTFPKIGKKILLLNAREIKQKSTKERFVLLAMDDITGHKKE